MGMYNEDYVRILTIIIYSGCTGKILTTISRDVQWIELGHQVQVAWTISSNVNLPYREGICQIRHVQDLVVTVDPVQNKPKYIPFYLHV